MNWAITIYLLVLFFCFTPGIIITLPLKNKYQVAVIHALLFTLVWQLTCKWIWQLGQSFVQKKETFINGSKLNLLQTTLNDSSFDDKTKINVIKELKITDETFSKIIDGNDSNEKKVRKLLALDDFTAKT